MKYGYLFYRKPLPSLRKERPINLGDPIQSIAVINLYKEMGIHEEDIIPIEKYDAAYYEGEEAIVVINGAEHYEHYAYHADLLPPSKKLTPVYFSLYFDRELYPEGRSDLVENFRVYGPVGCRDEATLRLFTNGGVGAYLTGCLTMTFPKREVKKSQDTVFLIDCPASLNAFLPKFMMKNCVRLSATERLKSISTGNRMTIEETEKFHQSAKQRLDLLRDRAKLVITSRYHAAVPAMAMGIPVILVRNSFDPRFEILERFLPLYTPEAFHKIDWNPKPVDMEREKQLIKEAFFSAVQSAACRKNLGILKSQNNEVSYEWAVCKAMPSIPFPSSGKFQYAVWGVCLPHTQLIVQHLKSMYPLARLNALIDTYQSGTYMNKPIIQPDEIQSLQKDIIILVPAPSAHKAAREKLENTTRKFVLIQGVHAECFHF